MDNLEKNLKYICEQKKGNIKDLIENIGTRYVSKFESIGFINRGTRYTWSVTKFAKEFYRDMFGPYHNMSWRNILIV